MIQICLLSNQMELSRSWHGNFSNFENRFGLLPIFLSQRGASGACMAGSVWKFEQEWFPAAHRLEFLVGGAVWGGLKWYF